jgi:hypothetical protein
MRLKDVFSLLDAVAAEYRVCRTATERLRLDVQRDPTIMLQVDFKRSEISLALRRLEHTYVVRLFACFEAALRDIWKKSFRRRTEPPISHLIDATASASSFMPHDSLLAAHKIREFRNSIVHSDAVADTTFSFIESLSRLKAFLSFMPRQW